MYSHREDVYAALSHGPVHPHKFGSGIAIVGDRSGAIRCRGRSVRFGVFGGAELGRASGSCMQAHRSRSFGAVTVTEEPDGSCLCTTRPESNDKGEARAKPGKRRFRRRSVELRGASRVECTRIWSAHLATLNSEHTHRERAVVCYLSPPSPPLSLLNPPRRPPRPWRRCSLLRPVRHPCRSALLSTRADRTHTRRPVCARTATAIQLEEPTRLADPVARPFSRARSSSAAAGTSHLVVRLGHSGRTELELDEL